MARGRARLAAELSPAGAGVEGCVTRRTPLEARRPLADLTVRS